MTTMTNEEMVKVVAAKAGWELKICGDKSCLCLNEQMWHCDGGAR